MKAMTNASVPDQLRLASRLYEDGNLAAAERTCHAILALEQDQFDALCLLILIKCRQRRSQEGSRLLSVARQRNPRTAQGWHKCGLVEAALGHQAEALVSYDRAVALEPGHADAHRNRGNVLGDLRRFTEAVASYDRAIALRPDDAQAHNNRGGALRDLNRFAEALASYDRAIALRPDDADAHYNRANVLCDLRQLNEALASYDRAIVLRPHHVGAYNNRGNALRDLKRFDEALTNFNRAIALKPDLVAAYNNVGNMLGELGRLEEARQLFASAIERTPRAVSHYYYLSAFKRFTVGDPHLAAMEQLARDMPALPDDERIRLHFALAKGYADLGEHERSFHHIREGNALKRRRIVYNEAETLRSMARIRSVFTDELMRVGGNGHPTHVPVFIVGMPRSGSTLVEQILASHPMVFGAGELRDFGGCVARLVDRSGAPVHFPDGVQTLAAEHFHRLGADYLGRIRTFHPTAQRITDKMPGNFNFVGLIHLALPNARIIHTRRDPIDICLSCFSRLFASGHQYAYDLRELARYYRAYEAQMAHWRRVLPAGVMLEVQYEDVVADLEGQARRIVAHCDLEWDEACLAFHSTERAVRTFSNSQVRQPIYGDSIGRWQPYAKLLGPLFEELGGGAPPEPRSD